MRKNFKNKKSMPKDEGLSVTVINGDVNKAIRKLKRKVEACGVLKEIHERKAYEKPSAKRRRLKKAATRRFQKKMQKRKETLGY